jgi:hypothetical protein
VVKCDGGWTGPYAGIIPSAPPIDVMPAVRKQPNLLERSHLLVPKLARDGSGKVIQGRSEWEDVDPETFMRQVEQRQREWMYFTEVIQMVKAWAEHEGLDMRTVAIEAMVLKYCPRPRMFETLSRGEAIARFFEAASKSNITSLKDPAGRCGEIDPRMNFEKLRRKLKYAAGLARQAMDAEYGWKNRFQLKQDATHPDVFWRQLFGKKYPKAREPFWRAPTCEPWFGKYRAEPVVTPRPGSGWLGGSPNESDDSEPKPPDDLRPNGSGNRDPKPPDDPDGKGSGQRPGGSFGAFDGARPTGTARRRPEAVSPRVADTGPVSWGQRAEPASDEPGITLWTGVFGPATATVSVPLTFG